MSNFDSGPAFPVADSGRIVGFDGMTLRDYFAAQALCGIISSQACSKANPTFKDVAAKAYKQAEAMIAEKHRREREEE